MNEWKNLLEDTATNFMKRFWSDRLGYLADTHDGTSPDLSLRPNQLWAIALPYSMVPAQESKRIIENVRTHLLTRVGLRTLAPSDTKYRPVYRGTQHERDLAYHQGTVWPWLLGIYSDALVRINGIEAAKAELKPLVKNLKNHFDHEGCIGHVSEVFDAEEPHIYGGAPAQAWSLAELLRVSSLFNRKVK